MAVWDEQHRWSAWRNTDPQGRNGGDAVESGRFLTRAAAEQEVASFPLGGFVEETVVVWGLERQPLRWRDVRPGGPHERLYSSVCPL